MNGLVSFLWVMLGTLVMPSEGIAQNIGDIFRKIQQVSKDSDGNQRLAQISEQIEAVPVEYSSRQKLAVLLQELEKLRSEMAAKDQTATVYGKWISKYLDVAIVRIQQATPNSK